MTNNGMHVNIVATVVPPLRDPSSETPPLIKDQELQALIY